MSFIYLLILLHSGSFAGFFGKGTIDRIEGRVVDSRSGVSLSAAVVKLKETQNRIVTTDRSGKFTFYNVEEGRSRISAWMTGYESVEGKRIKLEKGKELELNLSPVHDAVVSKCDTCRPYPLIIGRTIDRYTLSRVSGVEIIKEETGCKTESDREGLFSAVLNNTSPVRLKLSYDGYIDTVITVQTGFGRVKSYTVKMRPEKSPEETLGAVKGIVRGADGRMPLNNANVSLINTDKEYNTDENGNYILHSIPPGYNHLMVTCWGYEVFIKSGIEITAGDTQDINIILSKKESSGIYSKESPGTITGKVVDEKGDFISGAQVFMSDKPKSYVVSDYAGEFVLESVEPGVHDVCAVYEGYDTACVKGIDVWDKDRKSIKLVFREKAERKLQPESGRSIVTGLIADAETGEAVVGATAEIVERTNKKALSDKTGKYIMKNIRPNDYTLAVTAGGYERKQVEVSLTENEVLNQDIILTESGVETLDRMTVHSSAPKNTSALLLKDRKESFTVSDAVGKDQISQSGAGNAAEAMRFATGASIVDGKYIYIRGLGDRYTSTLLNGTEIPSTDPMKRAGSVDIIPSSLIDNIVTLKTFTPDRPGNFAGGAVNIQTKEPSGDPELTVSLSGSYNPQVNFNENTILYDGSSTDWLGFDNGSRELPEIYQDEEFEIPSKTDARTDNDSAEILDKATRAFSKRVSPEEKMFPFNFGISTSLTRKYDINGMPLGLIGGFTYKNKYSAYDNGTLTRWQRGSLDQDSLNYEYDFKDKKSENSVLWGGLINTDLEYLDDQKLNFTGIYNQNGKKEARELNGPYPYDLGDDDTYYTSSVLYTQRSLGSFQLDLKNKIEQFNNTETDLRFNYSFNKQKQPDLSYFTHYSRYNWDDSLVYGIKQNVPPARYWRTLEEDNAEIALDIDIPMLDYSYLTGSGKLGGLVSKKERDYYERLFKFSQDPKYGADMEGGGFNGEPADLFKDPNVGVDIDTGGYNDYKLYALETETPASRYHGKLNVFAGYLMTDWKLYEKYRLSGGYRFERTVMRLETEDSTKAKGNIKSNDHLWSLNLTYSPIEDMNCRFVTSRTLSRPRFREIAQFATFDFVGGNTFIGNADLKMTKINNFDLRWEWFTRPGDIIAVSGFYKVFIDPIQIYIQDPNYLMKPENVSSGESQDVGDAQVYGLEFEFRQHLDVIKKIFKGMKKGDGVLNDFTVGGNLAIINSKVRIPKKEIDLKREFFGNDSTSLKDLGISETRPFAGQSDGLYNFFVIYSNKDAGITSSLFFNYFGERLSDISLQGTPNIFEQPAPLLNFKFTYSFNEQLSTTFKAGNLLDQDTKEVMYYNDDEYTYFSKDKGRSYSLGLKYEF